MLRLLSPASSFAAAVLLVVGAWYLWITPHNPPGWYHDEASMSLNAETIARGFVDERGAAHPLFFVSFGDYISPVWIYALALVFKVVGPSQEAARGFAAFCMLVGIVALAWLAGRRARSVLVGCTVLVLAAGTPWLFEMSRMAVEVVLVPLVLALLLLVVEAVERRGRWSLLSAAGAGLLLGALFYSYAGARVVAPLVALALVALTGLRRRLWLATAWVAFAVTLVPALVYDSRHPGALAARYHHTTFVHPGDTFWQTAGRGIANYVESWNLWRWVTGGDPAPHMHAFFYGMLTGTMVALALAGAVLVVRERRGSGWWRFVLVATLLAPIPGAATPDRFSAQRYVPVVVLMLVLTVPALERLRELVARRTRDGRAARAVALALAGALAYQLAVFVGDWREHGKDRHLLFEEGVATLLRQGFAAPGALSVDYDERVGQAHLLWYAIVHHIPRSRAVILADGGVPPIGSLVFGRTQECDFGCVKIAESGEFWLARVTSLYKDGQAPAR